VQGDGRIAGFSFGRLHSSNWRKGSNNRFPAILASGLELLSIVSAWRFWRSIRTEKAPTPFPATWLELRTIFAEATQESLHCPLTTVNVGLLTRDFRDHEAERFLTARGKLVNEADLGPQQWRDAGRRLMSCRADYLTIHSSVTATA
jgi:hypothetical protein